MPVHVIATFPAVNGTALRVAVWSHYLAFAGSSHPNREHIPDEVEVIDLTTGKRRSVARALGGDVDNTVGVGDVVAWVEMLHTSPGGQSGVRWRIRAADLKSGEQWTVASSGDRRDAAAPFPVVGDGRISWTEPGTKGSDLYIARLSTTDRRRVVVAGFGGSEPVHLCHEKLVFTQWVDLDGRAVDHGPADSSDETIVTGVGVADIAGRVTVLPGSVRPPERAIVNWCDDSTVVWTLQRPADPSSAAPKALWSAPLAGGTATQIAGPNRGNAVVGAGFVAYLDDATERLLVRHDGSGTPTVIDEHPYIPARIYADGRRVAFATGPADAPLIKIAELG